MGTIIDSETGEVLSTDGNERGMAVYVPDNPPAEDTDDYLPILDEDARFNGLTTDRLLEIADKYGVGDIVRATLQGAY